MSDVTRPVALVTGAARGLGAATARELHDSGFDVILGDVDHEAAEATASLIGTEGPRATAVPLDVTSDSSVDAAVDNALRLHGRLDALVNNAGTISRSRAADIKTEQWCRELDVHLGGTMRCSRAAHQALVRSPHPAIVNLGSIASTLGLALRVPYTTAKAGIVGLTRALATEWGPQGIRVNAVAPGYIDTAMLRSGLEAGLLDEQRLISRTPLRRFGDPHEVARVIAFLVSPAASFITGALIPVDGGLTIDGTFHVTASPEPETA